MAEIAELSRTGRPEWTSQDKKRGVDPLGMQTTSVALYQELLPGISNVTLRVRYYGFYAWLAHRYARDVGSTSIEDWCIYVRRAEALYALIARHEVTEHGVAGSRWATRRLAETSGARIAFLSSTDREDGEPQYLKQKFGAFGAAYGSQLAAIGILDDASDHDIPVPTEGIGDALAEAFGDSAGEAAELFLATTRGGSVTRANLERMHHLLPSRIGKTGRERKLYEEILFGKGQSGAEASARRSTLMLVLRVSSEIERAPYVEDVRWAMYASRRQTGEKLQPFTSTEETQRFAWSVYQANDMLHACYETILKYSLDVLAPHKSGLTMERLVSEMVSRLNPRSARRPKTWQEFVDKIQLTENASSSEEAMSEYSLIGGVLQASNLVGVCSEQCAKDTMILLAVLFKRFLGLLPRVEQQLPVISRSPFVQSLVTELKFLAKHADEPYDLLLARLVSGRVLERHLWVAMLKLRGQSDYTFLLESDDGRVRVRHKDGPVLTNPRLGSAITFLEDIHLIAERGPTAAGKRILEAL